MIEKKDYKNCFLIEDIKIFIPQILFVILFFLVLAIGLLMVTSKHTIIGLIVLYSSIIPFLLIKSDVIEGYFLFRKKEKQTKKEEGGGLWAS